MTMNPHIMRHNADRNVLKKRREGPSFEEQFVPQWVDVFMFMLETGRVPAVSRTCNTATLVIFTSYGSSTWCAPHNLSPGIATCIKRLFTIEWTRRYSIISVKLNHTALNRKSKIKLNAYLYNLFLLSNNAHSIWSINHISRYLP